MLVAGDDREKICAFDELKIRVIPVKFSGLFPLWRVDRFIFSKCGVLPSEDSNYSVDSTIIYVIFS
ncbi:MAG: hypothetical protein JWP57_4345 [Spirosoma sp.]|nr:hypothetical protein [Spirosoma sp.]